MLLRTAWIFSLSFWCWARHLSLAAESADRVQGMCLDADKRPLNGVRVRVLQAIGEARPRLLDANGESVPNVRVAQETVTDATGRFWLINDNAADANGAILLRQSMLVLEAEGGLPEVRALLTNTLTEPKLTTVVRFVDVDKQPVTNVIAHCIGGRWTDATLDPGPQVGLRLTSDAQGMMQIPLGTGGTSVWVQAPGLLPFAFRVQSEKPQNQQERGFDILQVTAQPLELKMAPAGEAVGRVVDAAGAPIAGMSIVGLVRPVQGGVGPRRQIDLRGVETVSDEQGHFRLPGLPLDWMRLIAFDQTKSGEAEALVTGIPWQAGTLVVQPMRHVRGLVWDRGRNVRLTPQDEVRIEYRSAELGTRWSAAVDQRAEFAIPVPASVTGQPQLVPHPNLTQLGVGVPLGQKLSETLVVRVQQTAAMIPDAEVKGHLNEFPRDYALAEGQLVRHISAPFPISRQALWQSLRHQPKTAPDWIKTSQLVGLQLDRQPNSMIFLLDDRGSFRCVSAVTSETYLTTLLHHAFPQFPTSRFRFEPATWEGQSFERVAYAGDIVMRGRVSFPEGVGELQTLLQNECQLPVELTVGYEMIETLHARGRIDTGTLKGKKLPIKLAADASQGPYGWSGTPTHLIANVAQHLGLPYLFEAEVTGEDSLTWQVTWPPFAPPGSTNNPEYEKYRLRIMRQLAPAALKEQLGLEVDIHTLSLPFVTITPQRNP